MAEYAERDPEQLDKDGGYYFRHVMAMTSEKLHSKADIAAELAFRDKRIADLEEEIKDLELELNNAQTHAIYCDSDGMIR